MRPARRLLPPLAALALGAACAAPVAAAPDLGALAARERAATSAHVRAERALDDQRAALLATRARLDAARTRYEARLSVLRERLRQIYAQPALSPLLAAIAVQPGEAQAQVDLANALARSDAEMVDEYRRSLVELRTAESLLERRKERLSAETRILAARRASAVSRLRTARASVRARNRSTPLRPGGQNAPGVVRGLPAAILAAHSLPGRTPVDAVSGHPLRFDHTSAGPSMSVATPNGVVQEPGPTITGPRRFSATTGVYSPTQRLTASGERFDPMALSAANRTLPFGTLLRLTHGSATVVVRVNDRGPFAPGRDLDLSPAAARALGLDRVTVVRAEVVQRPG